MMTLTGFGGTVSALKPLLFRYYLDGPIRAGNLHVKLEEKSRSSNTPCIRGLFVSEVQELDYTGIDSMQLMLGNCLCQPSGYGGLVIVMVEVA